MSAPPHQAHHVTATNAEDITQFLGEAFIGLSDDPGTGEPVITFHTGADDKDHVCRAVPGDWVVCFPRDDAWRYAALTPDQYDALRGYEQQEEQ